MSLGEISRNGIWNPLTSKLGLTDIEQRAADVERDRETRASAIRKLAGSANDAEDLRLLADVLGLDPAEARP
jgi:hypothetical protein